MMYKEKLKKFKQKKNIPPLPKPADFASVSTNGNGQTNNSQKKRELKLVS